MPRVPDPEEVAYRRLQMEPNPSRYRAEFLAAKMARDDFAASFYLKLIPTDERKSLLEQADADTFTALTKRAQEYLAAGKLDEVIPLLIEIINVSKAKHGANDPATIRSMDELAQIYHQTGQFEKAIPLLDELVKIRKAKQDPETPQAIGMLGLAYKDSGQLKQAIAVLEEAATDWSVRQQLLDVYALAGEHAKVIAVCREQLEILRGAKDQEEVANSRADLLARLGRAYLAQKKWTEAEPLLRECLTIREKIWPEEWQTFESRSLLGEALSRQKKYAEAEPLLIKGYEGLKQRENSLELQDEPRFPESLDRLIEHYTATNKPDEVKKWQAERAQNPPQVEKGPMPRKAK